LVIPTLEPWVAGFTMSGNFNRSSASSKSAGPCEREALGTQLVHADRRAHHAAPGEGHAQVLEGPLQRSVLTARTVQRDPDTLEARGEQVGERQGARIERMGVDAAGFERFQHGIAGEQRDLAFARVAAEQHRHAAKFARI
jgi:hypothetical protein